MLHVPVLRAGVEYESLDVDEVVGYRGGAPLARVSRVNAGIIRRDMKKMAQKAAVLREIPAARLLEICTEAGEQFMTGTLPLNEAGDTQSPEQYVETLSATSGLPHVLVRRNMEKIATVFRGMAGILRGLTRGLDLSVLDTGMGEHQGMPVSFARSADSLGVVLPSNSPGVNSIWMPAIALKTPVVLKPGREEPWTPLRIVRAFIAAGCPPEAFSFYPTDHEGAAAILELSGRAQLFGDARTTAAYASNPTIEIHGPGWSKVILGADQADAWEEHLDILVGSVLDNGGRSCINASTIFVPAHGDEIADALARRMSDVEPLDADDEGAGLCAFPNPAIAEAIDAAIERGIAEGGAEDVTARHRASPTRRVERDGGNYLLPTVLRVDSPEHALAKTEYLFPFVSVVELPEDKVLDALGPSLVVSAITKDPDFQRRLTASEDIGRLNLGPLRTSRVEWDQPHEGNLFDHLYTRRAIQRSDGW
jgi:acyl-CoA reductase-like NAD-dependent aldehyde dehydrogenase